MNTDYNKWERYDVNAELDRMDEQETDEQKRQKIKKEKEQKKKKEGSTADFVQSNADALQSKAAVAALLAQPNKGRSRRSRRSKRSNHDNSASTNAVVDETAVAAAETLAVEAELATQISNGLKRALASRDRGLEQLIDADYSNAINSFDDSIQHVVDIKTAASTSAAIQQQLQRNNGGVEAAAVATADGVREDCHVGRGEVFLSTGRFAEAAEHMKVVLLENSKHAKAWQRRGQAFSLMGLPLLAQLHNDSAMTVTTDTKSLQQSQELNHDDIMQQISMEDEQVFQQQRELIDSIDSLHSMIRLVQKCIQEGDVIMMEGFYFTAKLKYSTALLAIETAKNRFDLSAQHTESLQQAEQLCELNIASCGLCLQRPQEQTEVVRGCERSLVLGGDCEHVLIRQAAALQNCGRYDEALDCYQQVMGSEKSIAYER